MACSLYTRIQAFQAVWHQPPVCLQLGAAGEAPKCLCWTFVAANPLHACAAYSMRPALQSTLSSATLSVTQHNPVLWARHLPVYSPLNSFRMVHGTHWYMVECPPFCLMAHVKYHMVALCPCPLQHHHYGE